jgi:hypothetical protein
MSSQIEFNQELQFRKQSFQQMTVVELRKMASGCEIKGRSKMNKQELVDALVNDWINVQQQLRRPVLMREKTLHICHGMTIEGENLVKCQNKSDKQHCHEHEHRYRFEKPDECPVCMDVISCKTETPLECGHWIHKACLIPTNLHICPVCRQQMQRHEVQFIFGANHQQINQYAHDHFLPFMPQSMFGGRLNNIDIGDFNNQEQFFNEMPFQYLFSEDQEDENGLHYDDDFDEHNGNFDDVNDHVDNFHHDDEQNDNNNDNEEIPELVLDNDEHVAPFIPDLNMQSPFNNMNEEIIEQIIQEIETRPRYNPYVTIDNDMNEIPDNMRINFINFVDRLINNFGTFENHHIDDIIRDEIRARLFAFEGDANLLRIDFNLVFVPHVHINFHMRLLLHINDRIRRIHESLTFSN